MLKNRLPLMDYYNVFPLNNNVLDLHPMDNQLQQEIRSPLKFQKKIYIFKKKQQSEFALNAKNFYLVFQRNILFFITGQE